MEPDFFTVRNSYTCKRSVRKYWVLQIQKLGDTTMNDLFINQNILQECQLHTVEGVTIMDQLEISKSEN
jgi:hypothetical protein